MSKGLTSLDFIGEGAIFPNEGNVMRLAEYRINLDRYTGAYSKKRKLVVRTADGDKIYNWKILQVNYFKLITDKFIGLLLNEKPHVTMACSEKSKRLNDLIEETNFWSKFQQVAMSFSQLGDGVFHVYRGSSGSPAVGFIPPYYWYKVVSPFDIEEVVCHVLAHPIYDTGLKDGLLIQNYVGIRFVIHYKGHYVEFVRDFVDGKIGDAIEFDGGGFLIPCSDRVVQTGLEDFAVHAVHNSKSVDCVYGKSDYDAIADLVSELEKRLTINSAILDKHSEPTMVADEDMFVPDELTGKDPFEGGNVIQEGFVECVTQVVVINPNALLKCAVITRSGV